MSTNNKKQSNSPKTLLLIMVAIASGFFGGYFGGQSNKLNPNNDNKVQREIISNEGDLISTIAKDMGPSVVSVNVTSTGLSQDFFGFGRQFEQQSAGTGVILSREGYIITNRHVVPRGVSEVAITLSDGREVKEVEVVGRTNDSDPLDIAFLKIKDASALDLKPANLGDSSKVEVGDRVVAIGNALGQFQNTVTSGIISGFGRDIEASDSNGANPESLQNLFQTDAAINGGNSGGPLVNTASEVIGINVATAGADNISFAIPINDVKGLIETVLEQGKLVRPYLGVRYVSITDDIAFNLELKVKRGAYIPEGTQSNPSIINGSPAEKAGLKPKDIIVEIDGTKLDEKTSVVSILGKKRVGDVVELKILRGDEEKTLPVTLEAAPEQ
jgi:serine protease Do